MNTAKVDAALDIFEDQFCTQSVELKTANQQKRDFCFRYVNLSPDHDPLQRLFDHGVLTPGERPVVEFAEQVREAYPLMGSGIDCNAECGIAKAWYFLTACHPIESILKTITSLPGALSASVPLLTQHGIPFSVYAHPQNEVFDPTGDSWSPTLTSGTHYFDSLTRLSDGRVLAIGSWQSALYTSVSIKPVPP